MIYCASQLLVQKFQNQMPKYLDRKLNDDYVYI